MGAPVRLPLTVNRRHEKLRKGNVDDQTKLGKREAKQFAGRKSGWPRIPNELRPSFSPSNEASPCWKLDIATQRATEVTLQTTNET